MVIRIGSTKKTPERVFLIFALVLLPVLVYVNTYKNSFQYDDKFYILNNLYTHDLSGIGHFFFSSRLISNVALSGYRPLTMATFALNYVAGGVNPAGYHLVNVAIHVLNTLLVFAVALTLMRSFRLPNSKYAAIAVAFLFACHPVNTQPVNYISGRPTLLVGGFSLLCFLLYARGRENPGTPHWALWTGSLAAYVCALFSKEEAVAVPGLLALFELGRIGPQIDKDELKRIFLSLAPFLVLTLGYLVFVTYVLKIISDTPPARGMAENLLTQARAVFIYLKLIALPTGLSIDHVVPTSTSILELRAMASVLALLGILAGSLFVVRTKPVIPFGIWWFVFALVPSSTLVALKLVVNEQRMYLPAIGIMFIAGAGLGTALEHAKAAGSGGMRKAFILGFAAILFIFSVLSVQRNAQWRTQLALWTSALEKYPDSARANTKVADLYLENGDPEKALDLAKKAVELAPFVTEPRVALAVAYSRLGMQRDALEQARAAVDLNPASADAQTALGIVYARLERYEEAEASWRRALELDPQNSEARENLRRLETMAGSE